MILSAYHIPSAKGPSIQFPAIVKSYISKAGLVGNIAFDSCTTEYLFTEIRNVFKGPMKGRKYFLFEILQPTGGCSKSLAVPAVSSSFRWSAGAMAKGNELTIYILAQEELQVIVLCAHIYSMVENFS